MATGVSTAGIERLVVPRLMTPDEFLVRLASELRLSSATSLSLDTVLRDDLDLDSLQIVELLSMMDDLGAEIPERMIAFVETAQDLYDQYATRTRAEGTMEMRAGAAGGSNVLCDSPVPEAMSSTGVIMHRDRAVW